MRLALGLLLLVPMVLGGCDELSSRREIQKANKLSIEGRYSKAVAIYEKALTRSPGIDIGHHNAGLAYYQLFQPGLDTPENKQHAVKAAEHFAKYLEENPGDQKIISLLTTIWLDSGQFDVALAYWQDVLAKNPDNSDVIEKLANINRQAGQYGKALEWHYKRADLAKDDAHRVKAYLDVAQMQWSRLQKPELVDYERLAVVDVGLAALQKAAALDPDHGQVQSLLGSMFQHRGLAHRSSWAQAVESASQRYHQVRFTEIRKAASGAADKQSGEAKDPPAPK